MACSRESITFTFTWGPSSLLLTVYLVLSRGQSGQGVKLATHLHVVPGLKNDWSYTSTPLVRLRGWDRGNSIFTFYLRLEPLFGFFGCNKYIGFNIPGGANVIMLLLVSSGFWATRYNYE
jgi:hypothetical protein